MTDTSTGRGTGDAELDRALIQRDIEYAAEEWLYMESEFPVRAANMRRMAYHCRDLLRRLDAAAAENERLRKERNGLWLRLDTMTSTIRFVLDRFLNNTQASEDLSVFVQPNAWGVTEWIRRDAESDATGGE